MCLCKWEEEIQKLDFVEGEMCGGYENAAQIKRTGSVLMKRTLPEQTCQTLTPKQLNAVLMQWNHVIDAIEQFGITRT